MNISFNEELWILFLKSINTILLAVLKFLGGLFVVALVALITNDYLGSSLLVKDIADRSMAVSFWAGLALLIANSFLDKKLTKLEGDEFSEALEGIDDLSEKLEKIRNFLKETQASIVDTRRELKVMEEEKDLIEPVLKTDIDLVKKILLTQSRHQYSQRWKERALSFAIGFATSIMATMLYDQYL
ncbi:MAG: hypothetical protein N0C86_04520 [Candidatus Thiodiazotropha taylori]|nr:hypothetical protein [Candidatus Thiodiazotropha taylori]MCW4325244.1 hypothetical protein [Candidatus Thiodiazotropha taylori]